MGDIAFPSRANEHLKYFPTNLTDTENQAERLAIVARGPGDSYTPGIYELRFGRNPGYLDFYVWDAPTHEEQKGQVSEADVDYDPSDIQYSMDLLFENYSKITCRIGNREIQLELPNGRMNTHSTRCEDEEIFKKNRPGAAEDKGLSIPLRIYSQKFSRDDGMARITVQTVWKGHTGDQLFTNSDVPNTHNVFAFKTQYGTVNLMATDLTKLKKNGGPELISEAAFFRVQKKKDYELSVNWIFPYAIRGSGAPKFFFDLDITNLPADKPLIIFDKDADSGVYGIPGNPPDNGIRMSILWLNEDGTVGDPLTLWSILDQTPRDRSLFSDYIPGEQNSYQGPSWDNSQDPDGEKYIHLYKFPLPESTRKSNTVRVVWDNFKTFSNAYGFAANVPIYGGGQCPGCSGDPIRISPDEVLMCKRPGTICLCEKNDDPKCFHSYLSLVDSISSIPEPETDELKKKGIKSIRYTLILKNQSQGQNVTIENLELDLIAPPFTSWAESTQKLFSPGKTTIPLGNLLKDKKKSREVRAIMNTDAPDNEMITTENRFFFKAKDYPKLEFSTIRHYLGKKDPKQQSPKITINRCEAYDYFGGEFKCSDACPSPGLAPGTKVTIRDTLSNAEDVITRNYIYKPRALNVKFKVDPNSVRLDWPLEENGIPLMPQGGSFPPVDGFTIDVVPAKGKREVFFHYVIPPVASSPPPGCLVNEQCECVAVFNPIAPGDTPPNTLTNHCAKPGSPPDNPIIPICHPGPPVLEATFSAIPEAGKTVYQSTLITYRLVISNTKKSPVSNMTVDGIVPENTVCLGSNCNGLSKTNPMELFDNLGTLEYVYTVKVKDNATGLYIFHPGHRIRYFGSTENEKILDTDVLTHPLVAAPPPTGVLKHDIRLTRKVVLNSPDGDKARGLDDGDITKVIHEFSYPGLSAVGGGPDLVYPYIRNGGGARALEGSVIKPFCQYQNPYPHSDKPLEGDDPPLRLEANPGSILVVYKRVASPDSFYPSFRNIPQGDLLFSISTDVPRSRPFFNNISGRGSSDKDQIDYSVSSSQYAENDINAVNYFALKGGKIRDGFLKGQNGSPVLSNQEIPKTELRAMRDGSPDGSVGNVKSFNRTIFFEEQWIYREEPLGNHNGQPIACKYQFMGGGVQPPKFYPPQYQWVRMGSPREIKLEGSDQDFVAVLTSTAWLQTRFGNLGFGKTFWKDPPVSGDPNYVHLGENDLIASFMKWFSPPNERNADFFIMTPDNNDPLTSWLEKGKISLLDFPSGGKKGFVPQEGTSKIIPSRGEAYDRKKASREYLDDLLVRQLYGKVVRLNTDQNIPSGIVRTRDSVTLTGSVNFSLDTIYYASGRLTIGSPTKQEVIIDGGKARLIVDGNAVIRSNVRYAKKSGNDLSQIPSLRLHATGNIVIDPSVTDVELLILAENEFHSGKSDTQLRILGDVIANKVFWERSPLRGVRKPDDPVNMPSEVIFEDFRKYILTPPGDKKLPDIGNIWTEVYPKTGKPILESILSK